MRREEQLADDRPRVRAGRAPITGVLVGDPSSPTLNADKVRLPSMLPAGWRLDQVTRMEPCRRARRARRSDPRRWCDVVQGRAHEIGPWNMWDRLEAGNEQETCSWLCPANHVAPRSRLLPLAPRGGKARASRRGHVGRIGLGKRGLTRDQPPPCAPPPRSALDIADHRSRSIKDRDGEPRRSDQRHGTPARGARPQSSILPFGRAFTLKELSGDEERRWVPPREGQQTITDWLARVPAGRRGADSWARRPRRRPDPTTRRIVAHSRGGRRSERACSSVGHVVGLA